MSSRSRLATPFPRGGHSAARGFPRSPLYLFRGSLPHSLVARRCAPVSLVRGPRLPNSCFSVLEHEKQRRRRTDKARQETGGRVRRLQLRLALGPHRVGGAGHEIEARRGYRVRPVDGVSCWTIFHARLCVLAPERTFLANLSNCFPRQQSLNRTREEVGRAREVWEASILFANPCLSVFSPLVDVHFPLLFHFLPAQRCAPLYFERMNGS